MESTGDTLLSGLLRLPGRSPTECIVSIIINRISLERETNEMISFKDLRVEVWCFLWKKNAFLPLMLLSSLNQHFDHKNR